MGKIGFQRGHRFSRPQSGFYNTFQGSDLRISGESANRGESNRASG